MRMHQLHLLTGLLVASSLVAPLQGHAEQCSTKSSDHRVALLELYTSEGCNSCPPADKFLSSLPGQGLTLRQVLPLSLHVDYWNNLGWRDPFSQTRFSERQREAARRGQTKFVYTPQFLLNGVDSRDGLAEKVRRINNSKASAEINLTMKRQPATKPDERGAARLAARLAAPGERRFVRNPLLFTSLGPRQCD